MPDDRFDSWLRDAARSYNEPPAPDADAMWMAIEAEHFDRRTTPAHWWTQPWLRVAAAMVIGIGLGRLSLPAAHAPAAATVAATTVQSPSTPYQATTSRYLGQTAALLTSLSSEVRTGHPDEQFLGRADDLLRTTRLLMDSPASSDPKVHALLDDLELVLAQIVRLQSDRSPTDLDLINQALEQRDVLPRLRTAVANISSAE